MALVLADRVRDTTTTTGTGAVTLSGSPPAGFQSFAAIGNGNTTYYTITGGSQWEVGIGTYNSAGPSLNRDTVLASSNNGNLVNFAAGGKDVFVTYPAERSVNEDAAGNVNISITGNAATATKAFNLNDGTAGAIPYQSASNVTAFLSAASGVLVGGNPPTFSTTPTLTGTNFSAIPNAALTNSSVTIGTTSVALGATSLTLAGLTSVTLTQDPTLALQAATKQYVDAIAAEGVSYHAPVKYETENALTATYNNGTAGVGATLTNSGTLGPFTPDGVVAQVGDRILVYKQANAAHNGVYTVTTVGSGSVAWVLTRATDANSYGVKDPNKLGQGDAFFVTSGNTGAGETYLMNTVGTITFGTTPINFVQISSAQIYSAGTGLTLTGTVFSLTSPVATSLGGTGLTTFTAANRALFSTSSSALTAGTLPVAAGGTGQTSYTDGQLLIGRTSDGGLLKATLTEGTGISVSNGAGAITITNTAPDQIVSLTGGGTTVITGSYPSFNITSNDQFVGTVTSVSGAGTVNGLTLTGTVTSSGSLTLGGTLSGVSLTSAVTGTLPVANGGTGAASLTANAVLIGNGTSPVSAISPGTAGNVLVSTGSAWASSAPPPSGPTLQAVASGSLADGSTVVINSNGTVSVVSGLAQAVGTPVNYNNADTSNISATYDSNAQRVVIAYRNNALSGFGTAVVGTVSGTSITFGTPVVFFSGGSDLISTTYDANAQRVVIAWRAVASSSNAIVGTVSGTSISFGSLVNFYGNTGSISATYDAAVGRVVIAFTDGNSIFEGAAIVGLVSGTSISFGSVTYFNGNSTSNVAATYDSNAQRVVIAYTANPNSLRGDAIVGIVSGPSISFGSPVTFQSGSTDSISAAYDSNAQRVVIAYRVANNGVVNVASVSGTSITLGAPVTFQTGMAGNGTSIVYDSNAQRVVVFYQRSSDSLGVGIAGTVTGTSISFGLPTTLPTGSQGWSAVYHAAQQRPVVAYRPNNTGFGAAAVFTTGVTNLTTENFIGFSNGAYTNGQTATIQLVGSVDDAQSGLTPGRAYFVQTTGGIGLTPASPSVFAGTAVAANRIIVKG